MKHVLPKRLLIVAAVVAVMLLGLALASFAAPADTPLSYGRNLISHDSDDVNLQGDSYSGNPQITPDGSKIVFSSVARNLTVADPGNYNYQIYLYDVASRTTTLVSHTNTNQDLGGNSSSANPQITPDGTKIVFSSTARDLTAVDPGYTSGEIYLYDVASSTTTLISHVSGSPDSGGTAQSQLPQITSDGSTIVFSSVARNLTAIDPGNNNSQVYLYDVASRTTTLVSHTNTNPNLGGNNDSYYSQITPDGSKIAFSSMARNLSAVDPGNNSLQICLYDVASRTTTLVSHTNTNPNLGGNGQSFYPQITPDSSKIVFISTARDLTAVDPGANQQVYLYDVASGKSTLISHDHADQNLGGDSYYIGSARITPDGSKIVFSSSARNLTAVDPGTDVYGFIIDRIYLYSVPTGTITLISHDDGNPDLADDYSSTSPAITSDGLKIAYASRATYGDEDPDAWGASQVYLSLRKTSVPETIITPPDGSLVKDGTLNFEVSDPTSSTATTFHSVNGDPLVIHDPDNPTVLPEGIHLVEFYSVDQFGNAEILHAATISVDHTPPITTPGVAGGSYTGAINFSLSAVDPVSNGVSSGVSTTHFSINGAPPQLYIGTVPLSAGGSYSITFWSTDNVGNIEDVQTVVYTLESDTTDPGGSGTPGAPDTPAATTPGNGNDSDGTPLGRLGDVGSFALLMAVLLTVASALTFTIYQRKEKSSDSL